MQFGEYLPISILITQADLIVFCSANPKGVDPDLKAVKLSMYQCLFVILALLTLYILSASVQAKSSKDQELLTRDNGKEDEMHATGQSSNAE